MTVMAGLNYENTPVPCHVVQLEHGADFFFLLPLIYGLISVPLCLVLQSYVWTVIVKREIHLSRLKLKPPRISENDEHTVDHLSTTDGSTSDSSDRIPRKKLSRRFSGIGDDLESYRQKLKNCQQENKKLVEELSEVYALKGRFAELLRVESEKSANLEKEVKIIQNEATDRERLKLELETFHKKEEDMMERINELQDSLDHMTSQINSEKVMSVDLQKELKIYREENELYKKVIQRFWDVREHAIGGNDTTQDFRMCVTILLDEPDGLWSYGELNRKLHDEVCQAKKDLALAQEEFQVCCNALANHEARIEEENYARGRAEDALLRSREQLSSLAELVNTELKQLSLAKANLKDEISFILAEEKNEIVTLLESCKNLMQNETIKADHKNDHSTNGNCVKGEIQDGVIKVERPNECLENLSESCFMEKFNEVPETLTNLEEKEITECLEVFEDQGLKKSEAKLNVSQQNNGSKEATELDMDILDQKKDEISNNKYLLIDDGRKALAQALDEKVAALLLLSQQEERHILEANTTFALESEISSLKQQLSQVTSEKVNALMELARVQQECLRLQGGQQYTRRLSVGQLSPRIHLDNDDSLISFMSESPQRSPTQGYIKNLWSRNPEPVGRTKSLSHVLSLSRNKDSDTGTIQRLHFENDTLRECLRNIRHLCQSANRLRLTIARVAAEMNTQTESSIQAAVEAVDGVISEALQLKVALHSSLPVDSLGWNSIGSPLSPTDVIGQERHNWEANDDLEMVYFLGVEIVRLVLLAAQLQKRFLGQNV